ncbi:lipopolysaccharide biosynthesis protein [Pedobacter cryoconitis]|uniref:Lipopolysaccharide biosynthesis protein n=1 Tax=Pedobacter cryoconitis TaxID=188932 RepID=A0A7X0MMF5_9SPHI|nr:lipopolysaccharide biosynthesis protein [Pedobacter cryoconitis]MBB6502413.1 hypothetical protein [Pedobacter cryoconitis]
MRSLSGKTILFFCPTFFNYEQEIKKALEDFGATVIWYDDRPSNNFYSKAVIRVNKNFLKNKIRRYYNEILDKNKDQKFDYLFFVNPESISVEILTKMQGLFPDAKRILYMWDSFKNRKQNLELLPLFNSMYTFDREDSISYNLKLRPLFYINTYGKKEDSSPKYELLFVGTAHSDRYTFVKKFCESNKLNNVKLYFYLNSVLLFFLKKLFDSSFKKVRYEDVSFTSLSHSEISSMMQQSKIVLDINHPKQIGLTMRTLETLGMQKKLLTTNKDILNYDFYNPANILLVERESPLLTEEFQKIPFEPLDLGTLFKYSISGWVSEIFELI